MILFFQATAGNIIAVDSKKQLSEQDINKLIWLFGNAQKIDSNSVNGWYIGPRKEMLTPMAKMDIRYS